MSDKINGLMAYLPVEKIFPHPDNPREDLGDLKELTASISAKGVLQNLTVVPRVVDGKEIPDEYTAVIGHRRHAAAKLAGLPKVPCVIADMTPAEQFETMMIENVQRNDLTFYEQAKGFQLMLDMGNSVAEVAKKTGFSETTIRKRSQLAQLDEEKFKKTLHRGATMDDYLKLNKIEDPERRDKVLETVGTAEFNNSYKKAMEEQKFKAFWQEQSKAPEAREDAKPGQFVYIKYIDSISLYEKEGTHKKKSPEEKLKEKLKKDLQEISDQFKQIEKRHREMRFEFIKNFTAFSTYEMDVAAFAARAMARPEYRSVDVTTIGKLLDVELYVPKGEYQTRMREEQWNKILFHQPQRAMLCAAYAELDRRNQSYVWHSWNGTVSVPGYQEDSDLNLLYECLKSLGYEMSEEEIQLQNGTHPLFDHATKLEKAYKEDLQQAKNNAKKDAKTAARKAKKK